jgi:hypothetical protein
MQKATKKFSAADTQKNPEYRYSGSLWIYRNRCGLLRLIRKFHLS